MRRFHRVAVLMGGPSSERDVSLQSGRAVVEALRQAGYAVEPTVIEGRAVRLAEGVEAAFIALHGAFGEDGGVQAELDALRVPYTGSGAESSRRAMDKKLSKQAFAEHGVPTAEFALLSANASACPLPLPVVVKPLCEGSSIGVHCVHVEADWAAALADARRYGGEVLVERFIDGRELTVGILEDRTLPMIEIVPRDGWYDFGAKYGGGSRYIVPAPVDSAVEAECAELARRTFDALGCRGFARVDFRLSTEQRPFVLELNSIPGFTPTSLLPKAAAAAGMDFVGLCGRIMETARYGD